MILYYVQIVEAKPPYTVVRIPGGGPLERDLVKLCTEVIVSKGVGLFRTESQVRQAIEDGMTEALSAVKRESRFRVI